MNSRISLSEKTLPLIILVFFIFASILYYYVQNQALDEKSIQSFQTTAEKRALLAKNTIEEEKNTLYLVQHFFNASTFVSDEEFAIYVDGLDNAFGLKQICWSDSNTSTVYYFKENLKSLCFEVDPLEDLYLNREHNLIVFSSFTKGKKQQGRATIFFPFELIIPKSEDVTFKEDIFIINLFNNNLEELIGKKHPESKEILSNINYLSELYSSGSTQYIYYAQMLKSNFDAPAKRFIDAISLLIFLIGILFFFLSRNLRQKNMIIAKEVDRQTAKLLRANEALKASNDELDQFAYIASHDLREPLRGMRNFSQFLIEDYSDKIDDTGVKYLNTIKKLGGRLERYLDSLLYYSRLGRQELAYKNTDLKTLIEECFENYTSAIETSSELKFNTKIPEVVCDANAMKKIFSNLFQNSIRYNINEKITLIIDYNKKAGGIHEFSVQDNGIGIDKEHWERIFVIFKRLHPREKFEEGTGIGLTIVEKAVKKQGGKIWVENSVIDQGTTFKFTISEN